MPHGACLCQCVTTRCDAEEAEELTLSNVVASVTAENGQKCEQQPTMYLEWSDRSSSCIIIRAHVHDPRITESVDGLSHRFTFDRQGISNSYPAVFRTYLYEPLTAGN